MKYKWYLEGGLAGKQTGLNVALSGECESYGQSRTSNLTCSIWDGFQERRGYLKSET